MQPIIRVVDTVDRWRIWMILRQTVPTGNDVLLVPFLVDVIAIVIAIVAIIDGRRRHRRGGGNARHGQQNDSKTPRSHNAPPGHVSSWEV